MSVFWCKTSADLATLPISGPSPTPPRVVASGCFDLLHVGHLHYLSAAAELGRDLVVLLSDDDDVRAIKGMGRPITPDLERAAILDALGMVSHVVVHSGEILVSLIECLRPEFFTKGVDYESATAAIPASIQAIVPHCQLVGRVESRDLSTSKIIARFQRSSLVR